jgi:hypothetical protein
MLRLHGKRLMIVRHISPRIIGTIGETSAEVTAANWTAKETAAAGDASI